MEYCEVCGAEYQPQGTVPPCPSCFEIAVKDPVLYAWIKKVTALAMSRAVWEAGEDIHLHKKHYKHDVNMHYTRH